MAPNLEHWVSHLTKWRTKSGNTSSVTVLSPLPSWTVKGRRSQARVQLIFTPSTFVHLAKNSSTTTSHSRSLLTLPSSLKKSGLWACAPTGMSSWTGKRCQRGKEIIWGWGKQWGGCDEVGACGLCGWYGGWELWWKFGERKCFESALLSWYDVRVPTFVLTPGWCSVCLRYDQKRGLLANGRIELSRQIVLKWSQWSHQCHSAALRRVSSNIMVLFLECIKFHSLTAPTIRILLNMTFTSSELHEIWNWGVTLDVRMHADLVKYWITCHPSLTHCAAFCRTRVLRHSTSIQFALWHYSQGTSGHHTIMAITYMRWTRFVMPKQRCLKMLRKT